MNKTTDLFFISCLLIILGLNILSLKYFLKKELRK